MQPLLVSKKLMMSMTEPDSDDGPTNPSFHLCQICNEVDKQYRCPRCGMFTCSLKCCKTHKMKVRTVITVMLHTLAEDDIASYTEPLQWVERSL